MPFWSTSKEPKPIKFKIATRPAGFGLVLLDPTFNAKLNNLLSPHEYSEVIGHFNRVLEEDRIPAYCLCLWLTVVAVPCVTCFIVHQSSKLRRHLFEAVDEENLKFADRGVKFIPQGHRIQVEISVDAQIRQKSSDFAPAPAPMVMTSSTTPPPTATLPMPTAPPPQVMSPYSPEYMPQQQPYSAEQPYPQQPYPPQPHMYIQQQQQPQQYEQAPPYAPPPQGSPFHPPGQPQQQPQQYGQPQLPPLQHAPSQYMQPPTYLSQPPYTTQHQPPSNPNQQ